MNFKRSDFPADFKIGTATSSYQIEGSSFGNCGPSHWDTFAATPGNVRGGENGAIACDHYNRWEEDLDFIADAGLDMYRFSTSWSRIYPEGKGTPNQEGLDFYDRLVDGILARNIEPHATLYHWELPAALADLGGWRNRDITNWFADYTEIIMERIGDRVASVATINEPWCVTWLSHFMGQHAPGLRDIRATAHSMHNVMLAHGKSIQRMREMGIKNLGLVTNLEYSEPADNSPQSIKAAKLYDGIYNRWFLGGVFKKAYPKDVLVGLSPHMPKDYEKDFDIIAEPVDWIGINYYTRKLIADDGSNQFPSLKEIKGDLPKTDIGWEIYPDGLHYFINWVHENYSKDLPIYITENGLASHDKIVDGKVSDEMRSDYIDSHLEAVNRAIKDGAPVKGYMIWSLLDNFEWALGYDSRFGMVHVDFETLKRTPKQSWHALKKSLST